MLYNNIYYNSILFIPKVTIFFFLNIFIHTNRAAAVGGLTIIL